MKKTLTVMFAVLTMLACVSCMDRTRNNTGYWENPNPNPTPGTVDNLDYLR